MKHKSNEEIIAEAFEVGLGGWVPAKLYLQLTGESSNMIKNRLKRGQWQRGVHYATPTGSQGWVNLIAIREWVLDSTSLKERELKSLVLAGQVAVKHTR